ncbi:MAG: hypothetical protein WCO12_03005 [bacterium]
MSEDKRKKDQRGYVSDKTIKDLKERFGGNLEVIMGSRSSEDAPFEMSYFYSNNLPKLEITGQNNKRTLEVEVSSIEGEDTQLLHYLHSKMIES